MTSWLDPVAQALDRRIAPVTIFVRDDDGGWEDDRQLAVLDLFAEARFPIDLALIPTAVGSRLGNELLRRTATLPIGLHQHGFAHLNHETDGRRCEFGSARPAAAQLSDVRLGREMLLDRFGPHLDSIFTPPWNRCTEATGHCLQDAGIRTLSRDVSAGRLRIEGLVECPVRIDWFAARKGQRLSRLEWAGGFAAAIDSAAGPLGLMLHHAVMNGDERCAWKSTLQVLARHPNVEGVLMREAIDTLATGR